MRLISYPSTCGRAVRARDDTYEVVQYCVHVYVSRHSFRLFPVLEVYALYDSVLNIAAREFVKLYCVGNLCDDGRRVCSSTPALVLTQIRGRS